MKKRLLSMALALVLVLGLFPAAPALAADRQILYFQNTGGWTTVNAYYWSDDDTSMTTWPGDAMTLVEDDVYTITLPGEAQYIIFNNNEGVQTGDLTTPAGGPNCYVYGTEGDAWSHYYEKHDHAFEDGWYHRDETYHFPQCDRCDYYDKTAYQLHADGDGDGLCDACGLDVSWQWEHEHAFEEGRGYSYGEGHHPQCDYCAYYLIDESQDHCDEDKNHLCDACYDWVSYCADEDHDHKCDYCGEALVPDNDGDGLCDGENCGKPIVTLSAKYTQFSYSEDEWGELLVDGSLALSVTAAGKGLTGGTVTVKWTWTAGLEGAEPQEMVFEVTPDAGAAVLDFAKVPLQALMLAEITYTPAEGEEYLTEPYEHHLYDDAWILWADSAVVGWPVTMNGFDTVQMPVLPGSEVTIVMESYPGDSYTWGIEWGPDLDYTMTDGTTTVVTIPSEDEASPAHVAMAAQWIHGPCVDSNGDHWCDSPACPFGLITQYEDGNYDYTCDICGDGAVELDLGDEGWPSLHCGVDGALASVPEEHTGATLTLLADCIWNGEGADWYGCFANGAFCLDLNGHTITSNASFCTFLLWAADVTVVDSSTEGGGGMEEAGACFSVDKGSSLTLKGGSYQAGEGRHVIVLWEDCSLDLSGHPDPEGITIGNSGSDVGVTGHEGDAPIMVHLPTGYCVSNGEGGDCTLILAGDTVIVQHICADTDDDHDCDVCGAELSTCVDNNKNHVCDYCDATVSQCADSDNNHKCDTCGTELSQCADENRDHKCDVCDETVGGHKAAEGKHTCDYCGETVSQCADNNSDHNCDVCGAELSDCVDNDSNHKCDTCGTELSQCADNNSDHNCDVCGAELSDCVDNDSNHKCDVCGAELSDCADNNSDHNCDVCGAELSDCADSDSNHKCDTCGVTVSQCADTDPLDHKCDVCGTELSDCADNNSDHNCDVCGETVSQCADNNSDHNCDVCGAELSDCADNNSDHNCDVCGAELSDCADNNNDGLCDTCGTSLVQPFTAEIRAGQLCLTNPPAGLKVLVVGYQGGRMVDCLLTDAAETIDLTLQGDTVLVFLLNSHWAPVLAPLSR